MTEKGSHSRKKFHRPRRGRGIEGFPEIFFCGDPHGEFSQINQAAREHKPAAMVILGDLQPPAPVDEILEEALAFTEVWWIPGNHDTDSDEIYDNIWGSSLADHNLNGRVGVVAGVRIAGLGGVFRGQIWMPDNRPNYGSVGSFIRCVGRSNTWRGGLPRRHRSSIFPSVYANLSRQMADILVTHEAPSCYEKGFSAVDRLAMDLDVRLLFHGHIHETIDYGTFDGIGVHAVGLRGIMNLRGEEVVKAQIDPKDAIEMEERGDAVLRVEHGTRLIYLDGGHAKVPRVVAEPWRDPPQRPIKPKKG